MMRHIASCVIVCLALGTSMAGEEYYRAIQKDSTSPLSSKEFVKLEKSALKKFNDAAVYETLANTFGNTTEKVWATIYGEVFCNLTTDDQKQAAIGASVYRWYDESIAVEDGKMTIALTQSAEARGSRPPFESSYELALLFSLLGKITEDEPLSIATLSAARQKQQVTWKEKRLPTTGLYLWQQRILESGHFEAYSYWLFRAARPEEFGEWLREHEEEYNSWLKWRTENTLQLTSADVQRLYLVKKGK